MVQNLSPLEIDVDGDGITHTYPITLGHYINHLLTPFLKQKDIEKFQKWVQEHMSEGILYGTPGGDLFAVKFKFPIETMLKSESGIKVLKQAVQESVLPALKNGHLILNTNIPPEIIKALGINATQIVEQKGITSPEKKLLRDQQEDKENAIKRRR